MAKVLWEGNTTLTLSWVRQLPAAAATCPEEQWGLLHGLEALEACNALEKMPTIGIYLAAHAATLMPDRMFSTNTAKEFSLTVCGDSHWD